MNTKFLSALTATAAATALFGAAAPAHAFCFHTSCIQFDNDTEVTFKFEETHGAFTSSLGIYGVSGGTTTLLKTLFSEVKPSDAGAANNYKGTLGNTVLGSGISTFTFLANQIYTLGVDSGPNGRVFSTTALNGGAPGKFTFGGSLFNGGMIISCDVDFQDFTVTAEAVPEPMTMTGLALGLGGLVAARRRRGSNTAS